jgi:mRNA interferase RelE/StbE
MKYSVIVHKRAAHYLKSLTEHQRERIKKSLKDLENGIDEKMDVKTMAGNWKGYYRMRVGDIRITHE